MPTMSRAAVLAILPSFLMAPCCAKPCAMWRGAVPVGSAPGEAVEGVNQNVDGRLGKARAHRALKGGDIAASGGGRLGRRAERPGLGEGVERFLLQLLRLEFDRLDLVAQGFLLPRIDEGLGAFELAARVADRNDGELAPAFDRGIELF